jgi:MoaA/NifB/PqqE/SkfB family radical SAM enzyme
MKKTVAFSKNAANIFFHLLTRCNLRCRHCYINVKQHGKNALTLETIEAWLEVLALINKKANVIFLGGEPTLHPDLPAAVQKAKALGYNSITVDTNGYLFNDILAKVTPDDVDYFSFSLDGVTRKTNDWIRGKGSFDTCVRGINRAVRKGFNTSLIYTVSAMNIHELDSIAPLLKDLKIDRFFIQVIGIRGKSAANKRNQLQISPRDWLKIVPDAARRIAQHGITVTYPKVFLSPGDPFECAGLVADNYFIFPNGRVYRCPLCEDYPLHSRVFKDNVLVDMPRINENDFFTLDIDEGCIMNKLIQPDNLNDISGGPAKYKIACCMLKEEIRD